MRIPRPIGITALALQGEKGKLYEKLSRKYLQGEFPFKGGNLSMNELSIKYRIPLKHLHHVVKEGIQEESMLGGKDLFNTLDHIRFKLLDNTIYQYGEASSKTQRLITYLERRVYGSQKTHPSLIKELNTALANTHKGIDSSSKILSLLNDALGSLDPANKSTEETLDRNEILEFLQTLKPDMSLMASEVKNTPLLKPSGTAGGVSTVPLKKVNGDYNKAKEIDNPQLAEDISVLPI